MLNSWINSELLREEDIQSFKFSFSKAKPFKHLMISNFLNENKAKELDVALKSEKFYYKDADLFQLKQTQNLNFSKNKSIKDFFSIVSSKSFSDFIGRITTTKLKPGAIDLAGSLYENTDYLLCHDDQVNDRKIAYILYLGEDFSAKDGGSFNLIANKKGIPTQVLHKHYPRFNHLMLFEVSNLSFHEVEEVIANKKRYAIGGWLH